MWTIVEHRRIARQVRRLPADIVKRYQKWKDIMTLSGPAGIRMIRGFRDESLQGEWQGHRSSRLNDQYRVIYRLNNGLAQVAVMSVTPHDYRRR
ncbi:type II toxin-antitoxin system YafQ family toxin [Halochromatium glycolicum]|uniref:Type II toxin-antitoxin system mRNA interferase toxin, RelE/StbE family n=1 Tax=Halochromatium glycolicum TaxID=85075 RepID=A0AAJ0X7U8_9GAMM|nr:type II toxin-antitoxin system mRNA interferase toxin, RelE/StbE family [Halochromatium glycolicum]MBK1703371.1 type II toxin-antitoxin system mRNA interferase toxin, RelE/StbE family [Halochromatium glycolicum]